MQRIPTQKWTYVVLLLWVGLIAAGCSTSKFRMAKGQSTRDGKLLVTCDGNSRRIAVRESGYVIPVGELELECTPSTGVCKAGTGGPLAVTAGTWVAVKAGRSLAASHAEGAICLKPVGASSCKNDEEYILDVTIECSDSPVELLYLDDTLKRWLPVRGPSFIVNPKAGLRLMALRDVDFLYSMGGTLVPARMKAGEEKTFAPGTALPEDLLMRAVANTMRVIVLERMTAESKPRKDPGPCTSAR